MITSLDALASTSVTPSTPPLKRSSSTLRAATLPNVGAELTSKFG